MQLRGPLDNAAVYLDLDENGVPGKAVTIPVEVKNLRDWMFPSSPEVYQLLEKAAIVQAAHPDKSIMPVLICRRAHKTLFRMAKDLGFFVIETRRQLIAPHIEEDSIVEVRAELGFLDLVRSDGPDALIVKRLTQTLPEYALDRSGRWAATATSRVASMFAATRTASTTPGRSSAVDTMREFARDEGLLEDGGGW